jgi:hypothetical protein
LVAGVGDAAAAQAGGGVVDHAIGTDEGLLPGLGADETSVEDEGDRLSNEFVEIFNGDLDEILLIHLDCDRIPIGRVKSKGSQPVTEAAFGGEDAILEAEVLGIVGIAGMAQISQ